MSSVLSSERPETTSSPRSTVSPLLRNTVVYLTANLLTAGLTFLFWVLAARLFSQTTVGVASTLGSAVALLGYLGLLGLNGTLIRFLDVGQRRDRQITQALIVVGCAGALLGLGYSLVVPALLPGLRLSPSLTVLLAAGTGLAALNLVCDALFVRLGKPLFNLAVQALLGGGVKVAVLILALGSGSAWILLSVVAGLAASTLTSLFVLRLRFGWTPRWAGGSAFSFEQARYSAGTHLAGAVKLLPPLVLPLIVLAGAGAAQTALYVMSFQLVTVVIGLITSAGEVSFAEASRHPDRDAQVVARSGLLCAVVATVAALGLIVLGPFVLRFYGEQYSAGATDLLRLLALSLLPITVHTFIGFLLKVRGQVRALLSVNLLLSVASIGLAALLAERGITWVGVAYLLANMTAAAVSVLVLVLLVAGRTRRTRPSPGQSFIPRQRQSPAHTDALEPVRILVFGGEHHVAAETLLGHYEQERESGRSVQLRSADSVVAAAVALLPGPWPLRRMRGTGRVDQPRPDVVWVLPRDRAGNPWRALATTLTVSALRGLASTGHTTVRVLPVTAPNRSVPPAVLAPVPLTGQHALAWCAVAVVALLGVGVSFSDPGLHAQWLRSTTWQHRTATQLQFSGTAPVTSTKGVTRVRFEVSDATGPLPYVVRLSRQGTAVTSRSGVLTVREGSGRATVDLVGEGDLVIVSLIARPEVLRWHLRGPQSSPRPSTNSEGVAAQ